MADWVSVKSDNTTKMLCGQFDHGGQMPSSSRASRWLYSRHSRSLPAPDRLQIGRRLMRRAAKSGESWLEFLICVKKLPSSTSSVLKQLLRKGKVSLLIAPSRYARQNAHGDKNFVRRIVTADISGIVPFNVLTSMHSESKDHEQST
jgi:hypothetical protein